MNPFRHPSSHLVFLAPALTCPPALAQVAPVPGVGEAIKQAQPPRTQPLPQRAAPVVVEQDASPMSLRGSETLVVRAFRFEGAQYIPEALLQAAVARYTGRALDMAEIDAAAASITALYRSNGFPVARAYVPRQDAREGTLTLRVLVGHYGRVTLKNQSRVDDRVLSLRLSPLAEDAPVSSAALERAMLLTGDLAGTRVPRVTLAPGASPGLSDVEVEVEAGPRLSGNVQADNQGSRHTGSSRLSATLDIHSLTGMGDRLSLRALTSGGGGLDSGRLVYSVPLSGSGLRADLAVASTRYELGGTYAALDATGHAETLDASLSYPLLRGRDRNLSLSLSLAARHMHDAVGAIGTENGRDAKAVSLAASYDCWGSLLGRTSYASTSMSLTMGQLRIHGAQAQEAHQSGSDTAGRYGKLNVAFSGGLALVEAWSATFAASAQQALGRNLDGTEQMALSGGNGVKAYREVVMGDHGYALAAEVRRELPAWIGLTHALGLFADHGRLRLYEANGSASNGIRQSDAGLGYYVSHPSAIASVQLARKLGPGQGGLNEVGRTRVLLQAGVVF